MFFHASFHDIFTRHVRILHDTRKHGPCKHIMGIQCNFIVRVEMKLSLSGIVAIIPFNYNFIFTRVITRGTTRILHCIPVTFLHRPRLLTGCNVHVSWKYTRGSTRMKAHVCKHTHGSTYVVQNTRALTRKIFYSPILKHYIN